MLQRKDLATVGATSPLLGRLASVAVRLPVGEIVDDSARPKQAQHDSRSLRC